MSTRALYLATIVVVGAMQSLFYLFFVVWMLSRDSWVAAGVFAVLAIWAAHDTGKAKTRLYALVKHEVEDGAP